MLIDAHIHLDLMNNMQKLVNELLSSDISLIAVGTTPKAYEKEKNLFKNINNVEVGLGLHPQLIADRAHEINLFLEHAKDAKYIGEIGLDFNTSHISSKIRQFECYQKMVDACAKIGEKVLSIHSVKSTKTVLDVLEEAGAFGTCKCIFHWYTGSFAQLNRAIRNGAYFSINPKMLKSKSGREIIKLIPLDKLLIETDAPFTKTFNSISQLKLELQNLIEDISELRKLDIADIIEENSTRIWQVYQ